MRVFYVLGSSFSGDFGGGGGRILRIRDEEGGVVLFLYFYVWRGLGLFCFFFSVKIIVFVLGWMLGILCDGSEGFYNC